MQFRGTRVINVNVIIVIELTFNVIDLPALYNC